MSTNGTSELVENEAVAISDSEGAEGEDRPADRDALEASTSGTKSKRTRSVSLSLRALLLGALIVALLASSAVFGWLYFDVDRQLTAQRVEAGNEARAEKIALDYAVNAATMDFKDLQAWHVRLVEGTAPELNKKLTDAGTSMEQVLVPLQWSSSAQPLTAKVRSSAGGVYVVDSFVSVQTKTIQAPEALQSTATYSTTIDSNNNWQITDVGGIDAAMGPK